MTYDHDHLQTTEAIAAARDALLDKARTLTRSGENLTGPDLDAFTAATDEVEALNERHAMFVKVERAMSQGAFEGSDSNVNNRGPEFMKRHDPFAGETRHATTADLRSRALSALEATSVGTDDARQAATEIVQRQDDAVAEWAIRGSDPAYVSAWSKWMGSPETAPHRWTDAERGAVAAVLESRTMSEGTTTAGGFMVPVTLSPEIMLSSDGSASSFRQVVRVEQLGAGKVWSGISSAGVTGNYATELAVVVDGAPTIANPQVPIFKGHAFVPFSTEVQEDVSSLGQEIAQLFADARNEADNAVFATGTGSNQPTGLTTALTGVAGSWTSCATNSAVTAADLYKIRRALGARFRPNASWMMNIGIDDTVRVLGDDKLSQQTVDLRAGAIGSLLGAPVYECSGLDPAATTTTNSIACYADFKRAYVWVDRVGSTVEYIPHLLDQATGRPYGARGFYLHWRSGGDIVNDAAAVLAVNQNTAFV